MSGWRLITGTTGLLGQFLLCEALENRERVAVLARGQRGLSAADRVNRLIASWEKQHGRMLERPVVLAGDLRFEGLRLSKDDEHWFKANVTSVLHNAASVKFQETASGEPMKSNFDGTRNLLNLCLSSRVEEFHYISSAYACGSVDRSQPVKETLHPEDGPFGNIYERSKCQAEYLVIRSDGPFTRTIFRPSIIVGDSTTGYASGFNALYTPLRLAWMMISESPGIIQSAQDLLDPLGVEGSEARNIVPVDWVSQAIGSIVREPQHHGGIYHVTNPNPTAGQKIVDVMVRALVETSHLRQPATGISDNPLIKVDLAAFRQHMDSYRSYFQSDPKFDSSRLNAAMTSQECPAIDEAMLSRIFEFAIRAEFKEAEQIVETFVVNEPRQSIDGFRTSSQQHTFHNGHPIPKRTEEFALRLRLSGSGGGEWHVTLNDDSLSCELPKHEGGEIPQLYASTAAFRSWCEDQFSFEEGLRAGLFVVTGRIDDSANISRLLFKLRSILQSPTRSSIETSQFKRPVVRQNVVASGSEPC